MMDERKISKKKRFFGYLLPNNTLSLSIIGIFSALICILTMIISIPIPATQGFINIGDAGVMITGMIFGPIIGGIAGGVGSSLADIFLGYTIYAPATLVIKGLEGFLVGLIADPKKKISRINYKDIFAVIIGGITMSFGYFLYEIFLFGVSGALYEIFLNLIFQFGLGAIIAILFVIPMRKNVTDNLPYVFDKIFLLENFYLRSNIIFRYNLKFLTEKWWLIHILIWIILFSILGSVGAITAAAAFVFIGEKYQKILIPLLISFAIGVLLAAALLGLIPEAIEGLGGRADLIMPYVLGGIIVFFFMEKIIIWRNCRNKECEVHSHASGPIILIGDSLHNLTDGIVIAAAFLTDPTLGIGAGLTILVHELAHETGDFGILLHSGYTKKKAFLYNIISSSTTIPAAIIGFFVIGALTTQHTDLKYSMRQLLMIITGILLIILLLALGGH